MTTPTETEEEEPPARMIVIEIEGVDEVTLERVAKEIQAICDSACKQYKYPASIEFVGSSIEDPFSDDEDEDEEEGGGV